MLTLTMYSLLCIHLVKMYENQKGKLKLVWKKTKLKGRVLMLPALFLLFFPLSVSFFLHILGRAEEDLNMQGFLASFVHFLGNNF